MRKLTHEQYCEWVRANRPEYEVIGTYCRDSVKILHKHKPSLLEWMCSPGKLKSGCGHPVITRKTPISISHEQYSDWVRVNRPEYQVVERYVNTKTKILHRHIKTGIEWKISPEKFKRGHTSTKLSVCPRFTHEQYVKFIVSNDIPIKPLEVYRAKHKRIKHLCLITGDTFMLSPLAILSKPKFIYKRKIFDTESYKLWLSLNRPNIVITEPYINSNTKINHLHVLTGSCWYVRPNNVQQRQNHPAENLNSCSYKSIKWLDLISCQEDIRIKHKLNGGEVKLPNVGKVDGFCEQTNTVYEFYGDFWHGNPVVFNPDDINPVTYTSFGELYQKTIKREQQIKQLKYNLVTVWERDFHLSSNMC